jgi:hypothetical protein
MSNNDLISTNNNEIIIDTLPLDLQTAEVAQKILDEQDIDKVKDLTHLFNLNQSKKNVLRVMRLNGLLDKVSDQIIERFEKRPGEFSNSDLLQYMQVVQASIDRANKSVNLVEEAPIISLNQQNINVNINKADELDRESKSRVIDAVTALLSQINKEQTSNFDYIVENNEGEIDNDKI